MSDIEYKDSDLVYVYPQKKRIIGLVEWSKDGAPLKKLIAEEPEEATKDDATKKPRRRLQKRFYPWCTYKTAKKVYAVEGKFIEEPHYEAFETVVDKAVKEAYWELTQ